MTRAAIGMDEVEGDRERLAQAAVAERISAELSGAAGPKLAKISTLLTAFRGKSGPTRLAEVDRILRDHGVELAGDWPGGLPAVRRTGVVRLTPTQPRQSAIGEPALGMTATLWHEGLVEQVRSFAELPSDSRDSVLWVNIDPPGRGEQSPSTGGHVERRATDLFERLVPRCPGLQAEMVHDLLQEDPQPKVESYGDEHGHTRAISVVAAIAREVPDPDDDFDGVDEEVVCQLVEILVGPGWLITCWHPSRAIRGADVEVNEHSVLQEAFLCKVRHWWASETRQATTPPTSSDLGLFLVRALVDTYDATHRMMERWMADWEVEFYACLGQPNKAERLRAAGAEISNYLYMTADLRRRLTSFEHARAATAERSWFPWRSSLDAPPRSETEAGPEKLVVDRLRSHKENFDRLSSDIRANMDVLMLQSTATQQETTERVQHTLGLVTGIILVPTLVVGFFGANTKLPGGGTWVGFDLMFTAMVLTGLAAFLLISRLSKE